MTVLIHRNHRPIKIWLTACLLLVALMVAVGGYTRLSGSGLSITQWKPIHGIIPPLDEGQWQDEFTAYQQSPQYAKINRGMELTEFKTIYWPEFWHRLLGRTIGFVFLFPLLFFYARKSISNRFALRLVAIFVLGGLQGLVGWLMVASGLVDGPFVSHIRLAIHLSLAFLLFALILWALLDAHSSPIRGEDGRGVQIAKSEQVSPHPNPPPNGEGIYLFWFTLLCIQIILGALMAGLHAGLIYNTWPMMNDMWLPPEIFTDPKPWYQNETTTQFLHRTVALLVMGGFLWWWYKNRHRQTLKQACRAVAAILTLQFMLGIATLIHQVPLPLALLHQLMGLALFAASVLLLHRIYHHD